MVASHTSVSIGSAASAPAVLGTDSGPVPVCEASSGGPRRCDDVEREAPPDAPPDTNLGRTDRTQPVDSAGDHASA